MKSSTTSSVRTVSLQKGPKGYGFNLSGQNPCVFSAVHSGSAAMQVGLAVGDRIVAVNNVDVSRLGHREIVSLIGSAQGELRLSVGPKANQPQGEYLKVDRNFLKSHSQAELLDSTNNRRPPTNTSEDFSADSSLLQLRVKKAKSKAKVPSRHYHNAKRPHKPISSYSSLGHTHYATTDRRRVKSKRVSRAMGRSFSESDMLAGGNMASLQSTSLLVHPGGQKRLTSDSSLSGDSHADDSSAWLSSGEDNFASGPECDDVIMRAVIVYIGAVPIASLNHSRREIISEGLRSLKAQRSRANTVLFEVLNGEIRVLNDRSEVIARFSASKILFAKALKQYFGVGVQIGPNAKRSDQQRRLNIVDTTTTNTSASECETDTYANCRERTKLLGLSSSSSDNSEILTAVCHLFAVDPALQLHSIHYRYAQKFGINCSADPTLDLACVEFPYHSGPLLRAVHYIVAAVNGCPLDSASISSGGGEKSSPKKKSSATTVATANGYQSSTSDSGIGNGREELSPFSFNPWMRGANKPPGIKRLSDGFPSSIPSVGEINRRFKSTRGVRFVDQTVKDLQRKPDKIQTASVVPILKRSGMGPPMISAWDPTPKGTNFPAGDEYIQLRTVKADVHKEPIKSDAYLQHSGRSTLANSNNYASSGELQAELENIQKLTGSQTESNEEIFSSRAQSYETLLSGGGSEKQKCRQSTILPAKYASTGLVDPTLLKSSSSTIRSSTNSLPKGAKLPPQHHSDAHLPPPQSYTRQSTSNPFKTPWSAAKQSSAPSTTTFAQSDRNLNTSGPAHTRCSAISLPGSNRLAVNPELVGTSGLSGSDGPTPTGTASLRQKLHRLARGETSGGNRIKQERKERLEVWANDFDRLLRDPAGICAFAEFLKKQYSHENISFWIACENYKCSGENEMCQIAKEIYANHFAPTAMEPVNVDSSAKQKVETALKAENYTRDLFNVCQYQIFQLMKYDCYPRFIKCDDYAKLWDLIDKGQPFKELREIFLDNLDLLKAESSKSLNDDNKLLEEKKSRRSLLSWSKNLARPKHKRDPSREELVAGEKENLGKPPPGPSAAQTGQISSDGKEKRLAWRKSKQLSMPAAQLSVDTIANRCTSPSPSVGRRHKSALGATLDVSAASKPPSPVAEAIDEGFASRKLTGRPSLAIPPDVVPRPDPIASGSPQPQRMSPAKVRDELSCTVTLPGGEKRRVKVADGQIVRDWLDSIAGDFGLNPNATDIRDPEGNCEIELTAKALTALAGKNVVLTGGVLFKVDIPPGEIGHNKSESSSHRRVIAVKASADKTSAQVLRPILAKYGLHLDNLVVSVLGTHEVVPNHALISKADGKKLIVLSQDEFQDWVHRDTDTDTSSVKSSSLSGSPTLEEISSRSKFQRVPGSSAADLGIVELSCESVVKPDHSDAKGHGVSGMLKFVRKSDVGGVKPATSGVLTKNHQKDKRQSAVLQQQEYLDKKKDEKKLAEVLSRSQLTRMDDQRGVFPADYDLPDFLKTKVAGGDRNSSGVTQVYEDDYKCVVSVLSDKLSLVSENHLELSGFIPTPDRAERYFGHSGSSDSASGDAQDFGDSKPSQSVGLGYHNVSLISVGNESGRSSALSSTRSQQSCTPDSPVFPAILLSEPDANDSSTGQNSNLTKRRGPPPPYPGRTPDSSRSRRAIVDVKSGENWNVDYV